MENTERKLGKMLNVSSMLAEHFVVIQRLQSRFWGEMRFIGRNRAMILLPNNDAPQPSDNRSGRGGVSSGDCFDQPLNGCASV